jgi:hypothetical protein
MAPEVCYELARLPVPELDAFVERGGGKEEAIGGEGDLVDERLVTREPVNGFGLLLGLPHNHGKIV